jgi:pilus assembly protein CpaF
MRWFDSHLSDDGPVAARGYPSAEASASARPPDDEAAPFRSPHRGTDSLEVVESVDARAERETVDLGPLAGLVRPGVTDVLVNGPDDVWTDSESGLRRERLDEEVDERVLRELASRLVAAGGRHLDHASPCVDAPLPGGGRVHAVIPPVATAGTVISVRFARRTSLNIPDLVASRMMREHDARRLEALVESRANLLVTGSAGAGKTTLLGALMGSSSLTERIVTIEDVREIRIDHPHVVSLEARQANTEGVGELSLAALVREALRMRPDRLVLGEVRGAEVRDMLLALGSGHDGGGTTLHARSLEEVGVRLEMLGGLAGLERGTVARMVECAIDAVIHVERVDGVRRVAGIGRPRRRGDEIVIEPLESARIA